MLLRCHALRIDIAREMDFTLKWAVIDLHDQDLHRLFIGLFRFRWLTASAQQ